MDGAHTHALERIARVLAGLELSGNANGDARSAAERVDRTWRGHLDDAVAILNALREPDERMIAAGDAETWTRMVCAALGQDVQDAPQDTVSWAEREEVYQKPLG